MSSVAERRRALVAALAFLLTSTSAPPAQAGPERAPPAVPEAYRTPSTAAQSGAPSSGSAAPVASAPEPVAAVAIQDSGVSSRAYRRKEHRWSPREPGWSFRYGGHLLVFDGFGALVDLEVAYRPAQRAMALSLIVDPLALSTGSPHPIGAFGARFLLAFDQDSFAIGASGGLVYARIVDGVRRAEGWGGMVGFMARVGARDGLHFDCRVEFIPVELGSGGVYLTMVGQIPTRGPWVRLEMRGGATGTTLFEFGLRYELRRDQEGRSLFITPTFGFGEILDPIDSIQNVGLLFGLTVEHRL